jgi:hypothetical protein
MLHVLIAGILAVGVTSGAWALDMSVITNEEEKLVYLHMWGPIVPGDDAKLKTTILPYLQKGYLLFEVHILWWWKRDGRHAHWRSDPDSSGNDAFSDSVHECTGVRSMLVRSVCESWRYRVRAKIQLQEKFENKCGCCMVQLRERLFFDLGKRPYS